MCIPKLNYSNLENYRELQLHIEDYKRLKLKIQFSLNIYELFIVSIIKMEYKKSTYFDLKSIKICY